MFDNIGKKIKVLAKVIFWIGVALSAISAILAIAWAVETGIGLYVFAGVGALIVGPVLSWIGVFTLYGFGELIDKTVDVERIVSGNKTLTKDDKKKIKKLEKLCDEELISEEECKQAIEKIKA